MIVNRGTHAADSARARAAASSGHAQAPAPLDDLRRHAVARTFFTPTTLPRAITKLGFVQADRSARRRARRI